MRGQITLVRRFLDALTSEQLVERLDLALNGANLGIWDWDLRDDSVQFDRRWCERSVGQHQQWWHRGMEVVRSSSSDRLQHAITHSVERSFPNAIARYLVVTKYGVVLVIPRTNTLDVNTEPRRIGKTSESLSDLLRRHETALISTRGESRIS